MPVSSHARHDRVPVVGVQRREAQVVRTFAEGHGLETALGVAPDLRGADLGVEDVRDLERDDAARRVPCPFLEVPVVPRADARERELGVVGELLQALAREAGQERREVERRVHAVDVHVGDARRDVPCTPTHLVEASRVEAVLAHGAADHRVEPDVGEHLPVVDPHLAPVVGLDDAGRAFGKLGRDTTLERVRRLDDVVVAADDRVVPLRSGRVGEECDLPLLVAREPRVAREVVDRDRHSSAPRLSDYSRTSGWSRNSMRTAPFQNASSAWVRNASRNDARNSGAISRVGRPAMTASAVSRHMRSNV